MIKKESWIFGAKRLQSHEMLSISLDMHEGNSALPMRCFVKQTDRLYTYYLNSFQSVMAEYTVSRIQLQDCLFLCI